MLLVRVTMRSWILRFPSFNSFMISSKSSSVFEETRLMSPSDVVKSLVVTLSTRLRSSLKASVIGSLGGSKIFDLSFSMSYWSIFLSGRLSTIGSIFSCWIGNSRLTFFLPFLYCGESASNLSSNLRKFFGPSTPTEILFLFPSNGENEGSRFFVREGKSFSTDYTVRIFSRFGKLGDKLCSRFLALECYLPKSTDRLGPYSRILLIFSSASLTASLKDLVFALLWNLALYLLKSNIELPLKTALSYVCCGTCCCR